MEATHREGAGWAEERLITMGQEAGGEPIEWGRLANENTPVLRTHDRYGNRIDEVEFHPAWHWLMEFAVSHGSHSLPWTAVGRAATRPGRRSSCRWVRQRPATAVRCR